MPRFCEEVIARSEDLSRCERRKPATRDSADDDGSTPKPKLESTVATANLRRQIPLLAVRTRQPDPSVAATAMVATPPPRGALGRTRTASEAGDADEAAPPAKRDCATSTANSRQQTYLTTFRVRLLQTPATPTMTPNQGSRPPCERAPERWRSASPRAQLPIFPPSASTQERASTRARPPPGASQTTAADQPTTAQPPAGKL